MEPSLSMLPQAISKDKLTIPQIYFKVVGHAKQGCASEGTLCAPLWRQGGCQALSSTAEADSKVYGN